MYVSLSIKAVYANNKEVDPIYELVFDLFKGCGQAEHKYLKIIQYMIMLKPIVKKEYD